MDRTVVREVPEGDGEQGKMEETGCEIICGAQTTLAVEIFFKPVKVLLYRLMNKGEKQPQNIIIKNVTAVLEYCRRSPNGESTT